MRFNREEFGEELPTGEDDILSYVDFIKTEEESEADPKAA